MRFPNDNLDDFKAPKKETADPPAKVRLEFTGETELLKPLACWEGSEAPAFRRLTWFHRSLAMGGALTVITFLLGTGLYLAIYGPPAQPAETEETAAVQQSEEPPITTDEPKGSYKPSEVDLPSTSHKHRTVALNVGRKFIRKDTFHVVYRVHHQPPQPQMWVSQFVPTTTIIYVENGIVRTRVEPQTVTVRKPALNPN